MYRNCRIQSGSRWFATSREIENNLLSNSHRLKGDRHAAVSLCCCEGDLTPWINECMYCFNRCLLGHSPGVRATHLSAQRTTQRAPGAGALPCSSFCPLHLITADDFIPLARSLSPAHIRPILSCYSFFVSYECRPT